MIEIIKIYKYNMYDTLILYDFIFYHIISFGLKSKLYLTEMTEKHSCWAYFLNSMMNFRLMVNS